MKIHLRGVSVFFGFFFLLAEARAAEWLVKLSGNVPSSQVHQFLSKSGMAVIRVEDLRFASWYLVHTATEAFAPQEGAKVRQLPGARWVESNKRIRFFKKPSKNASKPKPQPARDPIFRRVSSGQGTDPLRSEQWYLPEVGVNRLPPNLLGDRRVIVAVIDSGVDYNHPDLNENIWMNPGEAGPLATNGRDDDGNGYVDDFMGWDFADNDNLPWDHTSPGFDGNPGHGTHCAGVIAARADNAIGIRGVAPNVTIMPLRFMNQDGEGTTADAVKAMKYAVEMGAWVTSNSWGGEEEANDPDSLILREVFAEAGKRGRLNVTAAGNEGVNVDRNPMLATPASYNLPGMLSVGASTENGKLASFSNFGAHLVHLAAPGVRIISTLPNAKYGSLDGTSMAAPIVAGAAALFWSMNPRLNGEQVRSALLTSVAPLPGLRGGTLTGGRLDVEKLMSQPTERFRR